MPTFKTLTLGCKVNQYETRYAREGLLRLGYCEADDDEAAQLVLVNTCTVTGTADQKSRKLIRQLARENPDARIVVMGCFATRSPDEVASLPGVDEVIVDKRFLPDWLRGLGLAEPPRGITSFGQRHRAYVKVQDGCRMKCAYCIVPSVRPHLSSRPIDEVVLEARRLIDTGHRELVLTGIHLGHWGVENPGGPRLVDLVARLLELSGTFRLRLSSLEASEATDELIALMRASGERLCPHLHLSMQSGSDAVLTRMRRPTDARTFLDRCLAVREALDRPALTTDVIVGFPGETEADVDATAEAIRRVGFSKVHLFRFSPRAGTPAATMPGAIPSVEKARRAAEISRLAMSVRRDYFASLLGCSMQVLVESFDPSVERFHGTSERYVPVELCAHKLHLGHLLCATAVELTDDGIRAEPE